jgi:hypothetical protein
MCALKDKDIQLKSKLHKQRITWKIKNERDTLAEEKFLVTSEIFYIDFQLLLTIDLSSYYRTENSTPAL